MIILKSQREIERIRQAGKILAQTMEMLSQMIRPGIRTTELDREAERFIRSRGGRPSFKGYNGFPGALCISVNEELIHGIPGKRILQDGDIVSLDIGVEVEGYHADSAWTFPVGTISEEDQRLLDITRTALFKGLEQAKPENRLSDISHAIERCVTEAGFSIVREYVGHGVGQSLHEEPQIPNYGPPGRGPRLKPGMVLAIEPMVNAGTRHVRTLDDGWTVVTVDGKRCAHFEHTIAITESGHEILTLP